MKTTTNLYFKLNFSTIVAAVCIFLVCKTFTANATEISPLIGFGQEDFSFDLEKVTASSGAITFKPNISGITRLGVNAYGFGVGLGFRGSSKEIDPQYGTTKFFDLQLSYQQKDWGIEAFYQTYKGFYTTSTAQLQLQPDLEFKHYGLMGRYALSGGDFSLAGLMDQSDDITPAPGKFFVVGGLRHHDLNTSTSLLIQENVGVNTPFENLRRLKVTSLNLGLGYGKTWISDNRFFIGGLVDGLMTTGMYNFESTTGTTSSTYGTPSFNLRLGTGYAGETFKTGISLAMDLTTLSAPGGVYVKPSAHRLMLYFRLAL
ncbi:MAG: DUF4421 family protein [Bdellovibrio sp.]|nr:DUF4421 family protein [Bdellovibrio sp.]